MVSLHLTLGVELMALRAAVQLAGLSGLGVKAVFDVGFGNGGILWWPLRPAQGRHDEGVVAGFGPSVSGAGLRGLHAVTLASESSMARWLLSAILSPQVTP